MTLSEPTGHTLNDHRIDSEHRGIASEHEKQRIELLTNIHFVVVRKILAYKFFPEVKGRVGGPKENGAPALRVLVLCHFLIVESGS